MNDAATPTTSSTSPSSVRSLFTPAFWLGWNWKKEIANSDLPSEIQLLVQQVVSKSRLTRREKFDVAEELVQHFQDGHEQGLSFDQLVNKFGDPQAAALLIRRSKIRNRSLFVHAGRMMAAAMGCFFVAYLMMYCYYHSGLANPTIDYTAELNRHVIETPEEDKAWSLYQPMWVKYQFGNGALGEYAEMRRQIWAEDQLSQKKRLTRPPDEQWPQVVELLNEHQEALNVFREGAKLKSFGLELQADARKYSDEDFATLFPNSDKATHNNYLEEHSSNDVIAGSTIAILLPHVQSMREIARLLHVDTRRAVIEGDTESAVQNIETTLGLATQTAESPILVNALVAVAVSRIAINQLEEVLTANPNFFSKAQLARLQTTVTATDIHSWVDYSGERLLFKDTVQRCYTDDGNGDGRMTAAGIKFLDSDFFTVIGGLRGDRRALSGPPPSTFARLINWSKDTWKKSANSDFTKSALAPTSLITCASRKEVLAKGDELYQEIEADLKLPFWESRTSRPDGWKDFDDFLEENRNEFILLDMLMPSAQPVGQAADRADAQKNAVLIALAMHRYQLSNNEWPTKASDLIPKFLNEIPVDVLTGKPLHFKIVDNHPLIYSVGMDHDDDGGVDATENNKPMQRSDIRPGPKSDDFEGDWILWPQSETFTNPDS